ncbi:MAG: hypothetical protein DRH70_01175 [Candidatus Coatesbacteria bacterium]|nr:MAG: hypothetical protein DRH70_01175 [Candidatus Coatesbacteria bacterium]
MSMRYIERDLPVERLNPLALAEGNSKKPVYRMHKWWARRLGTVFRMITLAASVDAEESEAEIWSKFERGFDLERTVILDPFMGGGTTVVEALALGARVIGVDINPVAWFITKKEIEPVSLTELDRAFNRLENTAGKFIKKLYTTRCPAGHSAEVMYAFWVKSAVCSECGSRIRLFPNYELSRKNGSSVVVCPECLHLFDVAGPGSSRTRCPQCGYCFVPSKGVSGKGTFRCNVCGATQRVIDAVERRGGALDAQLFALEGYCNTCGRFFKRADSADIDLFERARALFREDRQKLLIPRQLIPVEGRSDPRPVNHGYRYFSQMFNERQLLCLGTLLSEIRKIPDRNVRELMLIAFSDCLDANNMFCKYEVQWHKISLLFGLHAFHPIERPTENNVWGARYGRSTFVKCYQKMRRAKAYWAEYSTLSTPKSTGGSSALEPAKAYQTRMESSFKGLMKARRGVLLKSQSSRELSFIPDASVDAVITDPPYLDNVQYSELADFFYVWLRLALKDSYACFRPELSSRADEMIQNDKMGKGASLFQDSLRDVFAECRRVLKSNGLLVFTFHHNRVTAWQRVAEAISGAGFYVSACPIVRSEGKSGFHSSEGNIRYDAVFVCRKGPSPEPRSPWPNVKTRIADDSADWVHRTLDSGLPVSKVDVFAILMAKSVEHFSRCRCNDVPLEQALQASSAILDDLYQQILVDAKSAAVVQRDRWSQLPLFSPVAKPI